MDDATTPEHDADAPGITAGAADGAHTTNGRPTSTTSLTPHLVVAPAADAIAFYERVLGATVLDVTRFPGQQTVAHAVLDFGLGRITLSDPMPAIGLVALDAAAGHPYSIAVYVPDVDAAAQRAREAGATIREEAVTFVNGDRFASIVDPFGLRWTIMTRVEDLSDEESAARVAAWARSQG